MSADWLRLTIVLCSTALSGSALSGTENDRAIWKDFGGSVTIQCRPPGGNQDFLILAKGLKDYEVLVKDGSTVKSTIAKEFTGRLQLHGEFPKVDILIKNLTSDDTGPYWCYYSNFDMDTAEHKRIKGTGSVLLVVSDTEKQCNPANNDLVLVSVVISAAVLLGILMGFFIWIIKTKSLQSTPKPRRVPINDVYEDMRGTIRR